MVVLAGVGGRGGPGGTASGQGQPRRGGRVRYVEPKAMMSTVFHWSCGPAFCFGLVVALYVVASHKLGIQGLITGTAEWAKAQGAVGELLFTLLIAVLMIAPIPFTPVLVAAGAVLPLVQALLVSTIGRQVGTSVSFCISRSLLRGHFDGLLNSTQSLQVVRAACEKEQWKITFLSRFSPLPIQVKNYCWGVLPVSFQCFFWCALVADFLHTTVSVYVGALGTHLASVAADDEDSDPAGSALWIGGFGITVCAMLGTTWVARGIYIEALEAAKATRPELFDQGAADVAWGSNDRKQAYLADAGNRASTRSRPGHTGIQIV